MNNILVLKTIHKFLEARFETSGSKRGLFPADDSMEVEGSEQHKRTNVSQGIQFAGNDDDLIEYMFIPGYKVPYQISVLRRLPHRVARDLGRWVFSHRIPDIEIGRYSENLATYQLFSTDCESPTQGRGEGDSSSLFQFTVTAVDAMNMLDRRGKIVATGIHAIHRKLVDEGLCKDSMET